MSTTIPADVAVMRITRAVTNLEDAIDAAIAAQHALGQAMIEGRIACATPAVSGHVAIMRLAKAGQALVTARTDVIRTHEDLFKVGEERGDVLTGPKPASAVHRFEEATAA